MRAAVANGADAVYFGLNNFNARHRAANFSIEQLPAVMANLHARNVRGYITLNTLIFSDELDEVVSFVTACAKAGADAIIVQDLGLAGLIHELCPSLPIHGSTQMTLTEPRGIAFVHELGAQRVILRASCRWPTSGGSRQRRPCRWRYSCMAPCASHTAASASPAN